MRPTRPYLLRAFYEWIADNNCTPFIIINADAPGVDVPHKYADKGQMVLNISMNAVRDLLLGNDCITFNARFDGLAQDVYIPIHAILAIYARENGRGMVFSEEDHLPVGEEGVAAESGNSGRANNVKKIEKKRSGGKPHLTVVK